MWRLGFDGKNYVDTIDDINWDELIKEVAELKGVILFPK